ncbi:CBF/Mak21 family-domain-containing protein [Xylariaceae sp. FL0016]|nr:CBF/Mak21 family-domain-containing protein [Xylariaceae sp. FL0016]
MPGAVKDKVSSKRKRSKIAEEASNKRPKADSSDDDEAPQDHILLLESEILESKKNYNNITVLLNLARKEDDRASALFATVSLCRVFLRLFASDHMSRKDGLSEKDAVVVQWLKSRLRDYKKILIAALGDDDSASTALTLAMRLTKAESHSAFPQSFLQDITAALVCDSIEEVRLEFCEKYCANYADIRYYTFKALKEIMSGGAPVHSTQDLFENIFDMLAFFTDVPVSAEDFGDIFVEIPQTKSNPIISVHRHRRAVQEAWLALFKLDPDRQQRKRILEIMSHSIAPWFIKPELLMDFLTDSYNSGGATSLLALSGVFYLIQERNLDYPDFYTKLYSLLDRDILYSKHRSRFLRLLDTFLASSHLPAVMISSFVKKLARLCLNAPPSAIVAIVPWVYNILKKHPACTFMLHRVPTGNDAESLENDGMDDSFIIEEHDPMQTHAIDSCLWEFVQLQAHYHPNVATIAKILSDQWTKTQYNLEDFLDHSYTSLLDAELTKPVKKAPVVEFMIPKRIFLPQDTASGEPDGLLVKLWDFQ